MNTNKTVRPEILALVELGNGLKGMEVSAATRAEVRKNLQKAFITMQRRNNEK